MKINSLKFNNSTIHKMYHGDELVNKIGDAFTYMEASGDTPTPPTPTHDYSQDYLTTESLEDGNTISFTMGTGMTTAITTAVTSVSVSTDDGVTWTSMENIGAGASLSVTLDTGEKAIWKGEALGYSIATASTKSTSFSSTGLYKVYGNILSLLYDDDFLNQDKPILPDFNCFTNLFYDSRDLMDASNLFMQFTLIDATKRPIGYLFRGCTNLIAAPELGNIDFASAPYAFRDMFHDCTSLTTAPALTATTLSSGCYSNMFQGCTSLTTAPELPAEILTDYCYRLMFSGCTSLTTAPELPATVLAQHCYSNMFNGCTSLNYIKCLAISISATNCTYYWVNGVSSTGTFHKAAMMCDWTTGYSGIPSGWTVDPDDCGVSAGDAD